MADKVESNEDGIHTGVTGPPNGEPTPTGRHEEVTSTPTVIIPVSDPDPTVPEAERAASAPPDDNDHDGEDGMDPEQLRNRITEAEDRALKTETVAPDADDDKSRKASTRATKPGTTR